MPVIRHTSILVASILAFSMPVRALSDDDLGSFGVEATVQPRDWVVHYKGQVSPPEDGTYRFVGRADDLLIVAVNRRVVLNGSFPSTRLPKLGWTSPDLTAMPPAANSNATYGNWLDLKAGTPVDLDILVGERPGGIFHAVLLCEKKGRNLPDLEKKSDTAAFSGGSPPGQRARMPDGPSALENP